MSDNYTKVFTVDDGTDIFIYSQDNQAWMSIFGELSLQDDDSTPAWSEGEPVKGSFSDEDFFINRAYFMAASEAHSLMDAENFIYPHYNPDDIEDDDERETIDSVAQLYADDLSEVADMDYNKAVSLIKTHLEGVIPKQ
jgi:hypothetical protein